MSLVVADLHKDYPTRTGPLPVLRGIALQLEPGHAIAILGPSGSGKSTLLNILGTLDRPTKGTVQLDGQDPFALSEPRLAEFRNLRIGFIFQDHHLLSQCGALENTLLPTLPRGGNGSAAERRARDLLLRVGLGERLEHRPAELSGGERQRVAVARALINRPRLVLADEPTGNLDRQTAQSVGDLLLQLCREENAILVAVTHSSELAGRFALRRQMLEGKLEDV
jgi:lipoprotein-releasing system ATP-binding protein